MVIHCYSRLESHLDLAIICVSLLNVRLTHINCETRVCRILDVVVALTRTWHLDLVQRRFFKVLHPQDGVTLSTVHISDFVHRE